MGALTGGEYQTWAVMLHLDPWDLCAGLNLDLRIENNLTVQVDVGADGTPNSQRSR